jgi:anti-sigma B factor antagonist
VIHDPLITVTVSEADGVEMLDVCGELDLTSAESLTSALAAVTARVVIVDLSRLGFIDSTGMRAIDLAHRRLAASGRKLLIVAPDESIAGWTFRIAGFEDVHLMDSREVALLEATRDGLNGV